MKVYALVGPPGTGKSHKSTMLASDMGIDYIIDDGLLIGGNKVIAGTSAKAEPTKIASVKRALFFDEAHRKEVTKSIKINKVESILILGTSDRMVMEIARKLDLSDIQRIIYIHDISEQSEITKALSSRKEKGKHVIPVPTFEIKKDFSGYLLDPLYVFRRKGSNNYVSEGSKTIVRPTFSFLGNYTISNNALYQISNYVAGTVKGYEGMTRFRIIKKEGGISIDMSITVDYQYPIFDVMKEIQKKVRDTVDRLTALHLTSLDITVRQIVIDNEIYP